MGGKKVNDRVTFPESVPIHLKKGYPDRNKSKYVNFIMKKFLQEIKIASSSLLEKESFV